MIEGQEKEFSSRKSLEAHCLILHSGLKLWVSFKPSLNLNFLICKRDWSEGEKIMHIAQNLASGRYLTNISSLLFPFLFRCGPACLSH